MPELVTFGETMVVMGALQPGLMRHSEQFRRTIGGAESNVAIGVARLGHSAGWQSRLGEDELGHHVLSTVRGEGVDTSRVIIDAQRPTGLCLKERSQLGDPRVFYYRKGSAASHLSPADLDEGYIASARILHVTGITPALSDSCRLTVFAAIEIARKHKVTVSFDPNMRYRLWSADDARPVLLDIARMSDIVLPGLSEAQMMVGASCKNEAADRFLALGAKIVAVKLGEAGALVAASDGARANVPAMKVTPVDTVGSGDAFAAAFLAGYLDGLPLIEAASRASVAGAMATLVYGDWEGMPGVRELDAARGQYSATTR